MVYPIFIKVPLDPNTLKGGINIPGTLNIPESMHRGLEPEIQAFPISIAEPSGRTLPLN